MMRHRWMGAPERELLLCFLVSVSVLTVGCIEQSAPERDREAESGETSAGEASAGEASAGETSAGESMGGEAPPSAGVTPPDQPSIITPNPNMIDLLFVIDDSSSMGEEQAALSKNFEMISRLIFDEASEEVDYRIAVTSMSVANEQANCSEELASSGRLLYAPADPERILMLSDVSVNGAEYTPVEITPETSDCAPDGDPVISAREINAYPINELPAPPADEPSCADPEAPECVKVRRRLLLEREFRCRAQLGIGGCTIEKGLEAMRLALSCDGPNADLFNECCVTDPSSGVRRYEPECVIEDPIADLQFLRPSATLAVIIVSDEDDCSTPADHPEVSSRLICQPGWNVDQNQDQIPDLYESRCEATPEDCSIERFLRECGEFASEGAEVCHQKRCDLEDYRALGCQQNNLQTLTPLNEYRDFLLGLKSHPDEQLFVATLVGLRRYLMGRDGELIRDADGQPYPLTYRAGTPPEDCVMGGIRGDFDEVACCPDGVCMTDQMKHSCELELNRELSCVERESNHECRSLCPEDSMSCELSIVESQISTPGTRYLDLADLLGPSALGCPQGAEPANNPQSGITTGHDVCLSLCADDFSSPFRSIVEQLRARISP